MKISVLVLAILLGASLSGAGEAAAGPLDAPWDFGRTAQVEKSAAGQGLMLGLVGVWQRGVAPVDGIRCPSEPSCSRYAAEAVRRRGALLGAMIAADRLIHELSEADHSPLVETPNGYKIDDPVSANDFWLEWH